MRNSLTRSFLLLGCVLCISACSNRPAIQSPDAAANSDEDWFCEMSASGDGWDCVRSDARAANPDPVRLPQPEPLPPPPARPALAPASPPPDRAVAPPAAAATQPEPAGVRQVPAPPDAPAYIRRAYRPVQPVPLTELPADFWAVQLIAFESRTALENYVQDKRLTGMSGALIARDEQIFYVLLMGVYEDEARAREAAASLPEQLLDIEPWVRPLSGLQEAMRAAEALQNRG